MENDDRQRGGHATVVSVRKLGGGQLRVVFDEAELVKPTMPMQWEMQSFTTNFDVPESALLNFEFTEEQLAALGRMLVSDLRANILANRP